MKTTMAATAAALLALAACRGDGATSRGDLGTGLNTVDRKYARPAPETWDAAAAAVKAHGLTVESDKHDSLGGELIARRAGGDKVSVKVRSLDAKTSDVSVRVDPGNRNMAEMIHDKIAEKLGLKEAKSAFFGGNSVDGSYASALDACVSAADGACRKLNLTVVNRTVEAAAAVVDARTEDSIPVQFKMKKHDDGTKVAFIAGRERNDAHRALAERMKAEFERSLNPQGN